MKKQRTFFHLLLIFTFLLTVSLSACSDSDTVDSNEPVNESEVQEPAEEEAVDEEAAADEESPAEESDESAAEDSSETEDESAGATGASEKDPTWLVMLYQDADDNVLEEDIFTDLNEAERIGSSDQVTIVAQIDRYEGGFEGEDDFTDARRYVLQQDDDLAVINSPIAEELGEVNMADGQTLVEFVTWAVENYPAGHYALILSDHGTGWPGGWTDPDPENDADNALMDGFDDMLFLNEMDQALSDIQSAAGIEKFDLIGFDACLMGSLEVFSMLEPYADYAVASQETEPSMGWAYAAFLETVANDPSVDGGVLAKKIVESYIEQDVFIIDSDARAEYVEKAYESGGDMSAKELAAAEIRSVTLTAVDLARMPGLLSAVDDLAKAMEGINQKVVAKARSHAQAFESVFGEDWPSPYIDLGHFAKLLKNESTSPKIATAVDALRSAIDDAVIAEKHGSQKKGATGISIYFPNSDLFGEKGSDYQTYATIAERFVGSSLWDDYLTFHYTGQPLAENNAPKENATVASPGAGEISIADIELSADSITVDETTTLSTTITGENVAFVYLFTGLLGDDGESIEVLDIDYIDADEVQEVDGWVYPDWGDEGEIALDVDWSAVQYAISVGDEVSPALLYPDTYGAELEDTVYSVSVLYTFADEKETPRYALLYFSGEGELLQIMGYSDETGEGPMAEITPSEGDQVTIYQTWIEPSENEETSFTNYEGDTLVFGEDPWTWEEIVAPAGEYVVGFLVQDFDGNQYESYVNLSVTE